jgi:sugar phosphate isomerase/epimerase
VKDMSKNKEQYFTEVGNGSIDWKTIFQHTETAGMKKFFVEQDVCRDFTPLESLKISYNYLKKLEF